MSVNLVKGQKISLKKEAGETLASVVMGLGWDQKKKKGILDFFKSEDTIDLDASCILFDEHKRVVDNVWFRQLKSRDGCIQHSGDNRTGTGEGDDEQITVNLSDIPSSVKYIAFTINSFSGQSFTSVENAFCRVINKSNNKEIARYNLSGGGDYTAQLMVKLYRHDGEWKIHAIGEGMHGVTFQDILPLIEPHL